MTPTERALRLSVALTERELMLVDALSETTASLSRAADSLRMAGYGAIARRHQSAVLRSEAILASISPEPANDPAPTTLGA